MKVIISVVVLRLRLGLGLDGQVLVLEGLRVKSLDNSPGYLRATQTMTWRQLRLRATVSLIALSL